MFFFIFESRSCLSKFDHTFTVCQNLVTQFLFVKIWSPPPTSPCQRLCAHRLCQPSQSYQAAIQLLFDQQISYAEDFFETKKEKQVFRSSLNFEMSTELLIAGLICWRFFKLTSGACTSSALSSLPAFANRSAKAWVTFRNSPPCSSLNIISLINLFADETFHLNFSLSRLAATR